LLILSSIRLNHQHLLTQDLIQGCIKGRTQAQKALYTSFLPYLLTIVRRYGTRSADERDAVQEIFIEVFTNLPKYDPNKGALKTWIRTLAVRKLIKLNRNLKNNIELAYDEGIEERVEHEIDYQKHDPSYILKAIANLPEGYRVVFNLFEVDGYSHEDIASMLDISTASSRSQLSRAKAALRKTLKTQTDHV